MSRRNAGFTLIELIMTLTVLALLLGLAAPSMGNMLSRSGASAAHNLLLSGFASARHHALHSRRQTTICPGTAETGCRADSDWSGGWIVFVDADGNGHMDHGETAIRNENALPAGIRALSSTGRPRATFRPNGMAPGTNLTLRLCHEQTRRPLSAVVLSNTGRARAATDRELSALPDCT